MHRILVEEKRWIGEERFLHALNFCMLLPGPEAQQLATYIGWLMHGTRGGLVAGGLFVLPGFLAIMAFSIVYVLWGYHPLMAGLFLGLKAAVVALIVQAILRIGRRALRSGLAISIAVLAFVAIFLLRAPFPLIILAAGTFGYLWTRSGRAHLLSSTSHGTSGSAPPTQPLLAESLLTQVKPSPKRALILLSIWLPLWFAPLLALALIAGPHHVFTEVAVFFSKMAVVTFGGAYAVLAYVGQEAAQNYHWLSPSQMLDGLGLAESTPGPLIMVVQFVGFLAAYQTPGIERPMLAAIFAACITVWVTFVPCFLWIFLGAPYVESLRQNKALSGALAAITAAVVGVIVNLALWFALHALFAEVDARTVFGRLILDVPKPLSLSWPLLVLISLAFVMTFILKWSMARMLVLCALLGVGSPLAWAGERPSSEQATGTGALTLEVKIPLGEVAGRIDHLAFDPTRQRVYVAELGNNSVGIVDLEARQLLRTVAGFREPQGIAYEPSTDTVYVANAADGSVRVFNASDFAPIATIALGDDADNVRVDVLTKRVYVGYGSGALAVIDPATRRKVADIPLKGHPESFQLDPSGSAIFVNVPDANHIALVTRDTGKQIASWSTGALRANFPLVLDSAKKRAIVIFRHPARLESFDSGNGAAMSGTEVCTDSDDAFVDSKRQRVYVICGEGYVDSLDASGSGFTRIARFKTSGGARTGLFIPELDRLLVAVRASGGVPAALWVLRPGP